MSSKRVVLPVLAALAAAAVVVGLVAVAGAGQSTSLPAVSAPRLLAEMGQARTATTALSGEVAWTNRLFGDLADVAGNDTFGSLPAELPLVSDGSGRLWMSGDGVRVESQGGGGDQIVVVSAAGRDAWAYDSSTDIARHWLFAGEADDGEAGGSSSLSPTPLPSATALTPEAIARLLERLAPYGRLEVAGQATVAGREAYLLRFTPAATDTALGAVQVAVDGGTFVPLRLEVYAAGGGQAVVSFGFESVSYDALDPSLFAFSPPAGADVTTKTIDGARAHRDGGEEGDEAHDAEAGAPSADAAADAQPARRALLSREQVQSLVPYQLAWARDDTPRPFRWGYVFEGGLPLTALGDPVFGAAGLDGAAAGDPAGDAGATADAGGVAPADANEPPRMGPASVLLYGAGFGAIGLAQTATTPEIERQLKQLPVLVEKTSVGGASAQLLATPLGGVVVWQQDGTTLVAAGMVSKADLLSFARSVR